MYYYLLFLDHKGFIKRTGCCGKTSGVLNMLIVYVYINIRDTEKNIICTQDNGA